MKASIFTTGKYNLEWKYSEKQVDVVKIVIIICFDKEVYFYMDLTNIHFVWNSFKATMLEEKWSKLTT